MIEEAFSIKIDLVCSLKKSRWVSYRVLRFSLSAAAMSISTEKYSRVCVFGRKRVSESHCETPGIYNYLAGVLFQQDCEVNKPTGEKRKREDERGRKTRRGIDCTNFEMV